MKTEPMNHQRHGVRLLTENPLFFALGAEQGTGKTWMLMADIENQWRDGLINAAIIFAPKGVHTNWVVREIPKHMSKPVVTTFWLSGAGKRHEKTLNDQLKVNPGHAIPIHAMNVDAVNTKAGHEFVIKFMKTFGKVMVIVDESQRIKNPAALRTKKITAIGKLAASRRISSGTLVANSPVDLYSQYDFLRYGLLGTTSYRAFVAEYAELLPASSPLVQDIIRRTRAHGTPQVIAKDSKGKPKFKNLERLSKLMSPYTYRITKEECLDLPAKIYKTVYFELSPSQRRIYDELRKDRRWVCNDGSIDTFTGLTVLNKLRQVTSGFVLVDGEPTVLTEHGERMATTLGLLEDFDGQVIVWANFRAEIVELSKKLAKIGTVVTYYGDTSDKDRELAVDNFQNGSVRFFVGNPAAAGTGLTLTAANLVIYYDPLFSLEQRQQSEDRCHRIGTTDHVVYIDVVGRGTVDEVIVNALQNKEFVAEQILAAL